MSKTEKSDRVPFQALADGFYGGSIVAKGTFFKAHAGFKAKWAVPAETAEPEQVDPEPVPTSAPAVPSALEPVQVNSDPAVAERAKLSRRPGRVAEGTDLLS